MNRRHALFASLLFFIPIRAEVAREVDFETYVNNLPACDRVEVIRLEEKHFVGKVKQPEPSELTAEEKAGLHYIKQAREWFKIAGKADLNGKDAERLASLYRAFKERTFPKGVGVSFCHYPPYMYRFYSGENLVGEASVCWLCRNLIVGPPEKRKAMYFEEEPKAVEELLDASNKLFPDNPAK